MDTEFEATYPNVDKEVIRRDLKKAGAKLIRPEFIQKRVVFHLPKGNEIKGGWLRIRDEGDKVTMSLKVIDGKKIEDQKEICLEVNSFSDAEIFLAKIGCIRKAYQESKRELWVIDEVAITIDEWPFLEPFVEIEGKSEESVREVSKKLRLDFTKAVFGAVDQLYKAKYSISEEVINDKTPEIRFNGQNPFLVKN